MLGYNTMRQSCLVLSPGLTFVCVTDVSVAYSCLLLLLCFVVSDTMSVGEAADFAELGSEPVKLTPLEPTDLSVEEVSGRFLVRDYQQIV